MQLTRINYIVFASRIPCLACVMHLCVMHMDSHWDDDDNGVLGEDDDDDLDNE